MKSWSKVLKLCLAGWVLAFIIGFAPPLACAKEMTDKNNGEEVDIHAIPPILDPHYRHRSKNQFEFSPYGGGYLGNTVNQTWNAGARLEFHINNTYALGVNYGFSRLMADESSTFGSSLKNKNLHLTDFHFMVSNDTAFRSGKHLIEMDFYATLGLAAMYISGQWQPAGMIGGGVKMYTGVPWLAFRVDVNSYLHFINQPGSDRFDGDIVLLGGISFLFPVNPSQYED